MSPIKVIVWAVGAMTMVVLGSVLGLGPMGSLFGLFVGAYVANWIAFDRRSPRLMIEDARDRRNREAQEVVDRLRQIRRDDQHQ